MKEEENDYPGFNRFPADAKEGQEYSEDVVGLKDIRCPLCNKKFIQGKRCFRWGNTDPRRPKGRGVMDFICHRCMERPENRPLSELTKEVGDDKI